MAKRQSRKASGRSAASGKRTFDALPDVPDYRDRWYEPTLAPLKSTLPAPTDPYVLDQGMEGACTGFGLAAVVNLLHQRQERDVRVSPRMFYEMARRHDEWRGEAYEGSSCRGAIKGWYHMGVCQEQLWPYDPAEPGDLTIERAKDARAHTIGAYYRVRKNIVDMHAALNEAGAVYASANVHSGWMSPTKTGRIPYRKTMEGGHAFAIVGYDADGFLVQNSWGPEWGNSGIGVWSYEDWIDNVTDAWVVQLALSTPKLYSRRKAPTGASMGDDVASSGKVPRRDEVAGHFAHVDDGRFKDSGKYWSTLADVEQTAALVAKSDDYQHLLIYAHGGLNSVTDSAGRIAAMRDTFKANGIYPFHFMYDTGLLEELKDVIVGKRDDAEERAGGLADWTDRLIERATRRPGRALWREMKSDAARAFADGNSPGTQTLATFLAAFAESKAVPKKVHLVGHSTGGILHAHLIEALAAQKMKLRIASVSLLAPAATVGLFKRAYLPSLATGSFGVDAMHVYNLTDEVEQADNVGAVYRKSLLYLVSRAFEENVDPAEALLGMQHYSADLEKLRPGRLFFHYSDGRAGARSRSVSTSHGGFDNDPATMNDILKTVLGKSNVPHPFTKESLRY
ncbi:MAG TPA: C1 family peptidase [Longimicrobiales bacterium]|nr:C1 family peptidase [Longimicrobiales bacterium]